MASLVGISRGNGFESNEFRGCGVCLCLEWMNGQSKGCGRVTKTV